MKSLTFNFKIQDLVLEKKRYEGSEDSPESHLTRLKWQETRLMARKWQERHVVISSHLESVNLRTSNPYSDTNYLSGLTQINNLSVNQFPFL